MIKIYSRYSLIKRMVQSKRLIKKIVLPFHEDGILPYKETCPGLTGNTGTNASKDDVTAHDLFNLFTADIIREKTTFIR